MKNFKIILAAAIIAVSSLSVSSCKRGPNDPFLSLKSRDARLLGVWLLVGMNSVSKFISISGSSVSTTESKTTYENGIQTTTSTGGGGSTARFNFEATFDKHGLYKSSTDNFNNAGALTSHQEAEGTWIWTNDAKNKTGFQLSESINDLFQAPTVSPWIIKQLKNNTLVVTRHTQVKSSSGSSSTEQITDLEFTFERQKK